MERELPAAWPGTAIRRAMVLVAVAAGVIVAGATPAFAVGTLTGDVRTDVGAAPGAIIQALDATTKAAVASTTAVPVLGNPARTQYTLNVPAGTYILKGWDPATSVKPTYSGKVALNLAEAVPVTVADGQVVDRQDMRLFTVGSFVGRALDASGAPLPGVRVEAWLNDGPPAGWGVAHFTYTDANGEYVINLDTLHFDYSLAFRDPTSAHRTIAYPAAQDFDEAGAVPLTPVTDVDLPLSDVTMDWGTRIIGLLTSAMADPTGETLVGDPAPGVEVHTWRFKDGQWVRSPLYWMENDPLTGGYDIVGLWPGTYRLSFEDPHAPAVWFDKVYTVPDSKETSIGLAADLTTSDAVRSVTATAAMWLFDSQAPFSQLSFTPGGPWVNVSPVSASIVATDDLYGVAGTEYSLDGSALTSYSAPFDVAAEGLHTVTYRSVDAIGNVEETRTAQIGIDLTPPSASIVGTIPAWYTGSASISIAATDALSGVKAVRYRIDSSAPATYTGSVVIETEGVYSLGFWAVDNAENASSVTTVTVRVDGGAPAVSSNIPTGWGSAPVTVTLAASDSGAGLSEIRYSIAGAPSVAYAGPFQISTEGPTTVEYWAVDTLDQSSAHVFAQVKIDTTKPTTTSNAVATYNNVAAISLSPLDALSGIAGTRYTVNAGAETSGTSVNWAIPGTHVLRYWSVDRAGNVEDAKTATFTLTATTVSSLNVTGANRFATAASASRVGFPSGAQTVIVVAGDKWADSVASAPLAGAANAPILLTGRDTLPAETRAEIRRLGARSAYIVGGTASVSTAVQNALGTQLGGASRVTRIAGADRYVTADAVGRRALAVGAASGKTWDGTAIIVSGRDFPDALSASPIAGRKVWPILLAETDAVGSLTDRSLNWAKTMGVKRVVVVGGDRSVTPAMLAKLAAGGIPTQVRLGGADRYAVSVAVANWATSVHGFTYNNLAIANGNEFADATTSAIMQARANSVLLLTRGDRLSPAVGSALRAQRGKVATVRFIGGTVVLTQTVRNEVIVALTP